MTLRTRFRSAVTGRFTSLGNVRRHPNTTVAELVRPGTVVVAHPHTLARVLADPALEVMPPGPARGLLNRIAAETGRYGARYELVVRETSDE